MSTRDTPLCTGPGSGPCGQGRPQATGKFILHRSGQREPTGTGPVRPTPPQRDQLGGMKDHLGRVWMSPGLGPLCPPFPGQGGPGVRAPNIWVPPGSLHLGNNPGQGGGTAASGSHRRPSGLLRPWIHTPTASPNRDPCRCHTPHGSLEVPPRTPGATSIRVPAPAVWEPPQKPYVGLKKHFPNLSFL